MNMADSQDIPAEFVQRLTVAQSSLYAFICGLMGGLEQSQDVLQNTNVKLWKRAAEYDAARPFLPWAYSFARWEVMAWRKTQQRSRLVLDDKLLERVAAHFEEQAPQAERELAALERCLAHLPEKQRCVVEARYGRRETVRAIAARLGQPENALAALLYRIRRALHDCITATLAKEGPP
jgi:RNA polymerase sigma-70 factor (ECF subfamily)